MGRKSFIDPGGLVLKSEKSISNLLLLSLW